jgi:hypothetical protein
MSYSVKINEKIFKILEAVPLSVFVISIKFIDDKLLESWKPLFICGGAIALIVIILFLQKKLIFNRILLAINLYLISGALASIFNKISFGTYFKLQGSGMILWVIAIGIISTIFSSKGFIGVDSKYKKSIKKYSVYLLACSVIAFIVSFTLKGNRILSELIPFTCLFIIQKSFQKKLYLEK